MNHRDIPTYDPKFYGTGTSAEKRIKELEQLVALYRENQIGPYQVTLNLQGTTWQEVVRGLQEITDACAEGPICHHSRNSVTLTYIMKAEENIDGGPGEESVPVPPPDPMAKLTKK